MAHTVGGIGRTIVIKGDVLAGEDLTVDGQVDGTIQLDRHLLTIAPSGRVNAEVRAKAVNVLGTVDGRITASETLNVRETATVNGALVAPQIAIEEGASFRGQIDISVTVPLHRVVKWLKPERRHVRFLRRLVGGSTSGTLPDEDVRRLFGVSPKLAAATMRLQVDGETHRSRAR